MFQMFKIDEGGQHYLGTAARLEEARDRVFALAEFWPAEYAILDSESHEWSSFPALRGADWPEVRDGGVVLGKTQRVKRAAAADHSSGLRNADTALAKAS